MNKELIIIRHARSMNNVGKCDSLDSSITPWGIKQAKNVGKFLSSKMDLKDFKFFTSPFLRCLETCSHINEAFYNKNSFQIKSELREYINHSGTNVHVPNRWNDFDEKNGIYWHNFPLDGINYNQEFNEQIFGRLNDFYQSLPPKSLIVTHGLPLMVLSHIATNNNHVIPVWDYSIDNCSITYIINGRKIWHGRNLYHEEYCESDCN